jgi:hypothetical protein
MGSSIQAARTAHGREGRVHALVGIFTQCGRNAIPIEAAFDPASAYACKRCVQSLRANGLLRERPTTTGESDHG